ncbi:MAG: alpha/beta fold hydrolase [Solidesulfovibrio sp.]
MATFVCVHGAFQGGWVWKKTAQALSALGHEVLTPTLSGCGHHRHAMSQDLGLQTYLQDIASFFELEDVTDAILVGHSYSGIICSGVMGKILSRLSGLVFVDAIILQPGRSFADLGGEPFMAMLTSRLVDDWLITPWPAAMFGVAGAPDEDWFLSRLAPFPVAGFTDKTAPDELVFPKKRHYVRCSQNPNPMLAAMADRAEGLGFSMQAIASNHCPQMTAPVELARALATIAESMVGPL